MRIQEPNRSYGSPFRNSGDRECIGAAGVGCGVRRMGPCGDRSDVRHARRRQPVTSQFSPLSSDAVTLSVDIPDGDLLLHLHAYLVY